MKPSVAIREALKRYDREDYLCLVIDDVLQDAYPDMAWLERANIGHEIKSTFMPTIKSKGDTDCLTVYLKETDRQYRYYVMRYGHDSKACFKRRVAWWERHIIALEERGL